MRKIVCGALCAVLIAGVLPLAACAKKEPRSRYKITAEYFPRTHTLSAQMTVDVVNTSDNAYGELKFELWPNAFREGATYRPVSETFEGAAYYKGESFGGIEIKKVDGVSGYRVCGEDENILAVTLDRELFPDERTEIVMDFEVTLAEVNHRLGAGERTVNLANFYPVLCPVGEGGFRELVYAENGDPFVSDCADYSLTLTVPEGLVAAYGGTGSCTTENGKSVYTIEAENVRDIAVVLGEFQSVKTEAAGAEVEYYYLSDADPSRALGAAAESLKYYADTFCDYAYPRYVVVETDLPYGGMEYPMLAMIGDVRDDEIAVVVAHETAHQWWYAMVGSDQFESPWQDEGLAEFSTALFFGAHEDYGVTYEQAVNASVEAYRAYFSISSQIGGANTAMNRPLTSYTGAYEYRSVAYDKGVVLFDRVRTVLGERRFFEALRRYCDAYSGKIATSADIVACFAKSGKSTEALFASFTDGLCVI